jgi:hypothetical protein
MSATLGSAAISRATLRIPRFGVPVANVTLTDDTALTNGSRLTLTVGDLALVGTVTWGSDFGGAAGYTWEAGAGKWSTVVPSRPYHDDNGIMLSRVAADLAADAGELGAVLAMPDRSLGTNWTRPAAPARDLLDALSGGQWWVASDGVTHVGPRPSTATTSSTLTLHYDPALRLATAQLADDTVSTLLPGVTLTAQGLAGPLAIISSVVHAEAESISVDLYGEISGPDLLRALVDALTQWRAYLRLNPYTVATVATDGRVAVQPADARDASSPDAPLLAHLAGIPGASYVLAPGAQVAVTHLAGDPGSPIVFGHAPGALPASVLFDATGTISLGSGASPLALANPLITWIDALILVLLAHGITPPNAPIIAATKAMGV